MRHIPQLQVDCEHYALLSWINRTRRNHREFEQDWQLMLYGPAQSSLRASTARVMPTKMELFSLSGR